MNGDYNENEYIYTKVQSLLQIGTNKQLNIYYSNNKFSLHSLFLYILYSDIFILITKKNCQTLCLLCKEIKKDGEYF